MGYKVCDCTDTIPYEQFVDGSWYLDPSIPQGLYVSNALGNEVGEVQEEVKKLYRTGQPDRSRPDKLLFELGDALYYMTKLAHIYGFSLEEIMYYNVQKLRAKQCESSSSTTKPSDSDTKQQISKTSSEAG